MILDVAPGRAQRTVDRRGELDLGFGMQAEHAHQLQPCDRQGGFGGGEFVGAGEALQREHPAFGRRDLVGGREPGRDRRQGAGAREHFAARFEFELGGAPVRPRAVDGDQRLVFGEPRLQHGMPALGVGQLALEPASTGQRQRQFDRRTHQPRVLNALENAFEVRGERGVVPAPGEAAGGRRHRRVPARGPAVGVEHECEQARFATRQAVREIEVGRRRFLGRQAGAKRSCVLGQIDRRR